PLRDKPTGKHNQGTRTLSPRSTPRNGLPCARSTSKSTAFKETNRETWRAQPCPASPFSYIEGQIMTSVDVSSQTQESTEKKGSILVNWMTSTDHKTIGYLYLITSFGFFLIAGIFAVLMRMELLHPNMQFMSHEQYNQLFTM